MFETSSPLINSILLLLPRLRSICMRDFEQIQSIKQRINRIKYANGTEDQIRQYLINGLHNLKPSFDFDSGESPNYFLIHALDTELFSQNLPFFTCAISVFINNILQYAVIYDIYHNIIYWAEHLNGAYINQSKIDKSLMDNKIEPISDYKPATINLGSTFVHAIYLASSKFNCGYFARQEWTKYHSACYLIMKESGYWFLNSNHDILRYSDMQNAEKVIITKNDLIPLL